MRLIDADAFKEHLASFVVGGEKTIKETSCGNKWIDGVHTAYREIDNMPTIERPHGECKTCKHYVPYREQFSYRPRGDGYCKSTITTSEGKAYINCHDEWYCANYEKEGGAK